MSEEQLLDRIAELEPMVKEEVEKLKQKIADLERISEELKRISEELEAENETLKKELKCEHIDNSAVCQDLRNVISEYQEIARRADAANHEHYGRLHDQIAIRDQKIEQLENELLGLRRMEQRWHKLLDEAEPSPEFLSGEAFRLNKEQS